jgi:hypothetical protein
MNVERVTRPEARVVLQVRGRYFCPIFTVTAIYRQVLVELRMSSSLYVRSAVLELLHVDRRDDARRHIFANFRC